jgi:hypothetical protein
LLDHRQDPRLLPFQRLHRPVFGRDNNDQAALPSPMMAG